MCIRDRAKYANASTCPASMAPAARSYRRARAAGAMLAGQVLALAYLANAIHILAFRYESATGAFRLTPAGLYGRRKMTALLRRQGHDVSRERVHRAMRLLRHNGIRRGRMVRTTIPALSLIHI